MRFKKKETVKIYNYQNDFFNVKKKSNLHS